MDNFVEAFFFAVASAKLLPWFAGVMAGLALCALGYPVIRLLLVLVGLAMGSLLGAGFANMMAQARPVPATASGVDLLVACGGLSIALSVASWFLFRLTAAAYAGIGLFAWIVYSAGEPVPPSAFALAVTGGIVLAVLMFLFTRWIVISLTAALGAVGAVDCLAALVSEGNCRLWPAAVPATQSPAITVLLVAATALTLVGGILVQARMPSLFGRRLAQQAPEGQDFTSTSDKTD